MIEDLFADNRFLYSHSFSALGRQPSLTQKNIPSIRILPNAGTRALRRPRPINSHQQIFFRGMSHLHDSNFAPQGLFRDAGTAGRRRQLRLDAQTERHQPHQHILCLSAARQPNLSRRFTCVPSPALADDSPIVRSPPS
jgi:hypothetical protein